MRGSVVKRGAGYSVVVELDRDPVTGKRRQKWHSGYGTKREAERAMSELVGALHAGTYLEPSKQTLSEFVTDWLAAIESTIRPSHAVTAMPPESPAARSTASRLSGVAPRRCRHAQRLVRGTAGRGETVERGRRPVTSERSLRPHDRAQGIS